MKKNGFTYVVLLVAILLGIAYFAWKNIDTLKSEATIKVVETEELRIMDVEKSKIDFSPLISAILYSHLAEGDLPLTLSFKTVCPSNFLWPDTLWGGFEHAGVRFVAPLGIDVEKQTEDEMWCNMTMLCEITELYSEMEVVAIIEFLKNMPCTIRRENVFIGDSGKKEIFLKEGWKPFVTRE